jgi:hypothetical protein
MFSMCCCKQVGGNKEHLLSPCGGFVPKALQGRVRNPLTVSTDSMTDAFSHMFNKSLLLLSWIQSKYMA